MSPIRYIEPSNLFYLEPVISWLTIAIIGLLAYVVARAIAKN
jgi:hypothetical protein